MVFTALAYSDSQFNPIMIGRQLKGVLVKETVTWDGAITDYIFPNGEAVLAIMRGHLWRLKGFYAYNAAAGAFNVLVQQMSYGITYGLPIGRYLLTGAATEAFGEVLPDGPFFDPAPGWTTAGRLLNFGCSVAPTNLGSTLVVAEYEVVE